MCSALGNVVGQEALKACSGKFTQLCGFFYFDADECLPDDVLPASQLTAHGRYASQIAVFGKDTQEKICDLNYFLVGAGDIGNETLKCWAMMGVGCGETGRVHVADMKSVRKSNLSRQLLFRSANQCVQPLRRSK